MTEKTQMTPMNLVLNGHDVQGTLVPSEPPTWRNPPDAPVLIERKGYSLLTAYTSQSTPNWNVPTPRYISMNKTGLKRSGPTLRQPALPRFVEPRPISPPIRRPYSSEASWQRALRKFGARVAVRDAKTRVLYANYMRRMDTYRNRLKAFEARQFRKDVFLNFSRMKKIGVIVPTTNNPYSKVKVTETNWNFDCVFRQTGAFEYRDGAAYFLLGPGTDIWRERVLKGKADSIPVSIGFDHPGPVMPTGPVPVELLNEASAKAINQLHSKVKDQAGHVGNMLAERAQTYSTLIDAVGRLRGFLHGPKAALKKYFLGGAKGTSRRVADDFLAYSFGVEPFVGDIYQIANKLSQQSLAIGKNDFVRVRSGGSAKSSEEIVISDYAFYVDEVKIQTEVRIRYMASYRVNNAALASLSSYGLLNPFEILWEVTPWSFVVDWFFPIGRWLGDLTADAGLTYEGGTKSVRTIQTYTFKRKYKDTPLELSEGRSWKGTIERSLVVDNYVRTVETSPPPVQIPAFKNPFSTKHFFLSMALWRQRF